MNLNFIIYKNKQKKWFKQQKKEFLFTEKKRKKLIRILNLLLKRQNNLNYKVRVWMTLLNKEKK